MAAEFRIGRYEVLQHLASGGMGRVYLGRSTGPGGFARHVVIKTLDIAASPPTIAMFLEEARVMSALHHQHIAPVFEVGRDEEGRFYLVMDYIHGQTAQIVVQRALEYGAALPIDFSLTVVSAAASALHYMHELRDTDGVPLNIIHRDATLSNLMIGYDGAVKVIDFGIARADDRSNSTRTEHGYVKGKVEYLSPEQVLAQPIDRRADIFTLGIVLYELTTMTRAFKDSSDLATLERIAKGSFAPPSSVIPAYPRGLERIVMKALARDAADRYPDADTMRRELEAIGHHQKLVLGDAAIVEIMVQLFEDRDEPWRKARPEFDDNAKTVAAVRYETPKPRMATRDLRHATEAVNQRAQTLSSFDESEETTTIPGPMAGGATKLPPPPIKAVPAPVRPPPAPIKSVPAPIIPLKTAPPTTKMAAEGAPRPPALTWILVGALAIAAAIGVVLAITMRDTGSAAATVALPASHADAALSDSNVASDTVIDAEHDAAHDTEIDAALDAAASDSMIHVHIATTPPDATLVLDGHRLGHTPFDGSLPKSSGNHVLRIRHRGYAPMKVEVDLTGDVSRDIVLQAIEN